MDKRLFYVVDAPEVNEEIFDTYEKAKEEYHEMAKLNLGTRLYIAEVNYAYYDEQANGWNYDDFEDTFNIIKVLRRQ
jgi:hypothetical protein